MGWMGRRGAKGKGVIVCGCGYRCEGSKSSKRRRRDLVRACVRKLAGRGQRGREKRIGA